MKKQIFLRFHLSQEQIKNTETNKLTNELVQHIFNTCTYIKIKHVH